jgi:hypothetical protein
MFCPLLIRTNLGLSASCAADKRQATRKTLPRHHSASAFVSDRRQIVFWNHLRVTRFLSTDMIKCLKDCSIRLGSPVHRGRAPLLDYASQAILVSVDIFHPPNRRVGVLLSTELRLRHISNRSKELVAVNMNQSLHL